MSGTTLKNDLEHLTMLSQEQVKGMKSTFKSDIEKQINKIDTTKMTESHVHALRKYIIVESLNGKKRAIAHLKDIADMSEDKIRAHTKVKAKPLFRVPQRQKTKEAAIERYKKYGHELLSTHRRRLYFPLITKNQKSDTENDIEKYLNKSGYFIRDYKKGYATDTDGKQEYKIGKLLKDNIDLSYDFMKDPTRIIDQQCLVLSNYANDIAYMSTRRGWESCMSHNGLYAEEPVNDIKDGTLVAYLINKNDPYIFNPLARVLLKPLNNKNNDTVYHVNKCYGLHHGIFKQTAEIIAEQISSKEKGLYEIPVDIYPDGCPESITQLPENIGAEEFLKLMNKDYTKDSSGNITVHGDLSISNLNIKKLPNLTDVTITGNFTCLNNKIISLEGVPQNIGGDFNCSNNQITSLEHAPQNVGGDFLCDSNQIQSLKGVPKNISGDFSCAYNQITSLEHAPQNVGGNFLCDSNQLTSLAGAPQKVPGGRFGCSYNKLTSLTHAPQYCESFSCTNNQLTSLIGGPKETRGSFYCSSNQLTSLAGAPQKIRGTFDCANNRLISLAGGPTEVSLDFYCQGNQLTSLADVPTNFSYLSSDMGRYSSYKGIKEQYLKPTPATAKKRASPSL